MPLNEQQIAYLENRRRMYLPLVGGWPPNLQSKEQLAEVRALLVQDIKYASSFVRENPANLGGAEIYGDLLRMGHNADVPGASKESVAVLQAVLAADPRSYNAALSIASLYVTLHPTLMGEAEKYFRLALELSSGPPDPLIFQGIGFSCLHQQKMEQAIQYFQQYLALVPGDRRISELVDRLASGQRPEQVYATFEAAAVDAPKAEVTSKPWWRLWWG